VDVPSLSVRANPTPLEPLPAKPRGFLHRLVGSKLFWGLFVLSMLGLPVARSIGRSMPVPPPVLYDVPAFRLVDQHGRPFGSEELRGRVYIANFIFTSCPGVCTRLTSKMASLQKRLKNAGDSIRLVSFSVDPARDTPEQLTRYAQAFGASERLWTFLTGPLGDIEKAVVEGFKVPVERQVRPKNPGAAGFFDIVHSERIVLVDQGGRIRGFYEATPDGLDSLMRDAGYLINLPDLPPAPRS
jgi:protein SCO1/2